MYADCGVLTIDTGAAATQYSVTGLTFTPKVVLLWWAGRPDTSDASGEADIQSGFGVAVSPTERWAQALCEDHAVATTASFRYHTQDACVAILDMTGAVVGVADFTSFNAGGFTLVIDDQFPAALRVSWLALGGSDLTGVKAGAFQLHATETGDHDYTGLTSFTPDFGLFATSRVATAPPSGAGTYIFSLGVATALAQAVLSVQSNSGNATSDTASYCRTGEMFAAVSPSTLTCSIRASLTSFLTDGFRINTIEGPGANYIFFLALKGGSYEVGNFVTATDTTEFSEGVSFQPKATLFASANRAESTADIGTTHIEQSLGAAAANGNQNAQYVRIKDGSADSDCFSAIEHDSMYINGDNSATQIIEGLGKVNSMSPSQMLLQMTDADPVASFVWYAAFGGNVEYVYPEDDVLIRDPKCSEVAAF